MGFWSGLGKGLLKAAPIAAAFIPGVGPLASMAISGAAGATGKKLSGGSWKDALISGGIGAGTSYGLGKITGLDKIGGKAGGSFVKDDINKAAGQAVGRGIGPTLGNIAKGVSTSMLGGDISTPSGAIQ